MELLSFRFSLQAFYILLPEIKEYLYYNSSENVHAEN